MGGTEKHLLIPKEQIWLLANDCDGQAFAQQFHDCWERIPIDSRQRICGFWSDLGPPWPKIELSDLWGDSKRNHAKTDNVGRQLYFNASSFRILPLKVADWIVAHELAHVYQKACGMKPGGKTEQENERDANRIAMEWGFNGAPNVLLKELARRFSFEQSCAKLKKMGY